MVHLFILGAFGVLVVGFFFHPGPNGPCSMICAHLFVLIVRRKVRIILLLICNHNREKNSQSFNISQCKGRKRPASAVRENRIRVRVRDHREIGNEFYCN